MLYFNSTNGFFIYFNVKFSNTLTLRSKKIKLSAGKTWGKFEKQKPINLL